MLSSASLRRAIRKKQRLYNKAKTSQCQVDWDNFKTLRADIKTKLSKAYHSYIADLLEPPEHGKKPSMGKRFWSFIKSMRKDNVGVAGLRETPEGEVTMDSKTKAEILSNQFKSVFTVEDLTSFPTLPPSPFPNIPALEFDVDGITKLLKNINVHKASGPDQIPCWILKTAAIELAPFLQRLFTLSIKSGTIPVDWSNANIHAVFKKGDKSTASNYRPISLTSVVCKIMEHILFRHMMLHMDDHNILTKFQHGFREGHSCESQLIIALQDFARNLDKGCQTDCILLDFSKAFDRVAHERLLSKLAYYGIKGELLSWLRAWLTNRNQTVVVEGEKSKPTRVKSGVPQGTVLGPLMFLVYINDICNGIDSQIRLFADDTIVYGVVRGLQDASTLQHDLDRLFDWSRVWQMSFNPDKCSVLRICRLKNPTIFQYAIGGIPLRSVSHHPYLGIELTSNLDWGHHITNVVGKANQSLGFIRRNLGSCPESVKVNAYTTLVRPRLEYASSAWDPHLQKHQQDIEGIQRRAARFVKGCYKYEPGTVTNLLKELNWPSLEMRRKIARLIIFYKIVNGLISIELPPYIQKPTRVTRSYHPKRFINMSSSSNTYKFSFYTRTIKDWNLLPDYVIEMPTLSAFKSALLKFHVA